MIYLTIVQSIAEEVWVINKKNERKILATEMEYWRRCCGITRADRITNEEIRRRMETERSAIAVSYTHLDVYKRQVVLLYGQ